jgi:gliding motility-associated-like protein
MARNFIILLCCSLFFIPRNVFGQLLPPDQPEQDACTALQLCGDSFFTPYSYQGIGLVPDMVTSPCYTTGESNSSWFRLEVNSAGSIVFSIIPVDSADDYDYAFIDITNSSCDSFNIMTDVIRCNFNNNEQPNTYYSGGIIGLNTTSTLTTVPGGSYGNPFLMQINANAGDVYLIMINNYGHDNCYGSCPGSGFTLDFSGSTATFNQPPPPEMESLVPYCDFSQSIVIQLNDNVLCNSIDTNGSNFYLTPFGTIASEEGLGCSGIYGYTDQIQLNFSSPLTNGDYTVLAQTGGDGNTLLGLCNSELQTPDSLNFHVGHDPISYTSIDSPACQKITLHFSNPFACNSVAANGSDFLITGPSPVTIVSATGVNCSVPGAFTQAVQLTLMQPIAVDGIYQIQAQVGTDGNTLADSCGRILPPGSEIPFTVNSFNGILQAHPDTIICRALGAPINLYGVNNGIAPPGGFQYQWVPSTGIQNPNSMNTPVVIQNMLNNFILETVDANGCYLRDSVTIKVEPFHGSIDPEEATVCNMDLKPLMASGGIAYQWYDNTQLSGVPPDLNCNTCPDPVATLSTVGDKTYYVIITNDIGCTDTLQSLLHIRALPDITVLPKDTMIKYGTSITLMASGGFYYNWYPAGSLNDAYTPNPVASPKKTTSYVVTGADKYGCLNYDTSIVRINFRDPVLVPSAFSPNGDGLNDVFKIEHLTFQKVLAFRVYDRWGNLVFETTNPEKGWDGTFDGKPMNPDVYQYYIKLGYPDDYVETYKGSVTLIR